MITVYEVWFRDGDGYFHPVENADGSVVWHDTESEANEAREHIRTTLHLDAGDVWVQPNITYTKGS